jgi:hypothetical protein
VLCWKRRLPTGKKASDETFRRREGEYYPHDDGGGGDRFRLRYGFWIIITGFALVAIITIISIFRWAEVTSVATVVGAVASLVGTVVGAFFGVQVGGVGKERADAARERSEELTRTALSMLPPEAAEQLRSGMNR